MPNSRTRAGPCAFHARTAAAENDYKRRRRDNYRRSLGFLEERLTLLRERHSQEEGLWDRRVITRERELLRSEMAIS